MAKKPTKSAKPTKNTKSTKKTSRVVTSRGPKRSRFQNLLGSKLFMLAAIIVFAGVGTYFLALSHADPAPHNNAAKGLVYDGLVPITKGVCSGQFQDSHPYVAPNSSTKSCTHPDPGPAGVDVRVRGKQIDAQLAAQLKFDAKHPPKAAGAKDQPAPMTTAADIGSQGSLSAVTPNLQPCVNAGSTTSYSVRLVYAYPAGGNNRYGAVNDELRTIAHRVNAVMYNSSISNGGDGRQVRFTTNNDCSLSFVQDAISGNINDFGNIKKQLIAQGRTSSYHKFLVWVDGGSGCGISDAPVDSTAKPTQDNWANYGGTFSVIWHGCWNYAEPHELMHSLGAVNYSAPHATSGAHCYDEHDVMCYDDGTAHSTMQVICPNTVNIWRYDCNHNDYFNSNFPISSGYLSSHWNTANSRFLAHY
jgi:hypothetical protein